MKKVPSDGNATPHSRPRRRRKLIVARRPAAILLVLLGVLLLAAGCNRRSEAIEPTPLASTPAVLPDRENSALITPETGGVIGLNDGAEVKIPPEAIPDKDLVALRRLDEAQSVPVPRSLVGSAYEFSLGEGRLTGVALLALPLPDGTNPEQYDLSPYRWTGRAWERLTGRLAGNTVRLGTDQPGVFAILGQWRLADASATVTVDPVQPGQRTVPVRVTGQYRYTSLPMIQHGYTQASLRLKRDSSGGAGQVTGDESLDQTVAETVVWFNPDPAEADGVVDFTHTFDVSPAELGVPIGETTQLYAVLTVDDSAAPTRRFSAGAQYVQMVPIQVIGSDVIGGPLPASEQRALRWHVSLNGETLFVRPAGNPLTLSLAEALATGGLGEYKVFLEMDVDGKTIPASNEVTVQLALPTTATPEIAFVPGGGGTPTAGGTVFPFGPMPPTPTRRSPGRAEGGPAGIGSQGSGGARLPTAAEATPTAPVTPTVAATATSTRAPWEEFFWADAYQVAPGGCTTLHWHIENIREIALVDYGDTVGIGERQVCLDKTTTFTLHVTDSQDQVRDLRVTVTVTDADTQGSLPIAFWADSYLITAGTPATIHWKAEGVRGVYLKDPAVGETGVAGVASVQVTPGVDTTYELTVDTGSEMITKKLTIYVKPSDTILMQFWAEQYTLPGNGCTTLHWSVRNVDKVTLTQPGKEEGVAGESSLNSVCPSGTVTYKLRAEAGDRSRTMRVTLHAPAPPLADNEVIAQGSIRQITRADDLDADLPGEQPGWRLLVEGINRLEKGGGDCCDQTITLQVLQDQAQLGDDDPRRGWVDWPLRAGQRIEFDARCSRATCKLAASDEGSYYLKQTSP